MTDPNAEISAPDERPLRVAAVLDGTKVPAWVNRIIEDQSRPASYHFVAMLTAISERSGMPQPSRSISSRIYELADSRLFPPGLDAFAERDLPKDIYVEQHDASLGEDRTRLGPMVLSALTARQVDVVIGLGVPPLEAVCPTGISLWSLEIGGRSCASWLGTPVPELLAGIPFAVVTVREWSSDPLLSGGMRRSVTGVVPWSASLTRNKVMWSAASLVVHALQAAERRAPCPRSPNLPLQPTEVAPSTPSRTSASAFALRQVARLAGHAIVRAVARDEWNVALRPRDAQHEFGQGGNYRVLKAPPGHSYADPFVFEHDERHWLFLEDFVYANRRARIVCVQLGDDGAEGEINPVLDEPHHLSYPFVFKRGTDIFMIPESAATNSVELYRAASFPDRWESLGPMLSGLWGSDATLMEHDGLLWMFVTLARPGMHPSDELHLYYGSELLGPWEAHPMNPVVSDVRAGRAAGRLFWHEGRLIRPAQDSARRYGHAINFQAVTQLTTDDFEEHTVARLDGSQINAIASHTYNFDGRYETVDLLRPRARWHR